MKTLLLTAFIMSFYSQAWAQPQTQDCGANFQQVSRIIQSKFSRTFPSGYAEHFIGKWKAGFTSFEITRGQDFVIRGQRFAICPQANGRFFIYQISNPSEAGYFQLQNGAVAFSGGRGLLAWANGLYHRQSTQVAGN